MANDKRTQFAIKALGFADLFNLDVGAQKVPGFRVELSAPEGQSTGGGAQAVQHIKLVSLEEGGSVIVAGSANQVERKAEIRSYAFLADLHAQRYRGAALPLDQKVYGQLVGRMQAFFAAQGLALVTIEARPPAHAAPSAAPVAAASSSRLMLWVALLVLAAAAAFALFKFKG